MDPLDHSPDTIRHLAEAEAALVLLENVLHTLIAKGILGREEVVGTIESVVEVKRQMAEDGMAPVISHRAAGILTRVANTIAAESPPSDT